MFNGASEASFSHLLSPWLALLVQLRHVSGPIVFIAAFYLRRTCGFMTLHFIYQTSALQLSIKSRLQNAECEKERQAR